MKDLDLVVIVLQDVSSSVNHILFSTDLNDIFNTYFDVSWIKIGMGDQLFVFALSDFLLPLYYLALRRPRRPVDM